MQYKSTSILQMGQLADGLTTVLKVHSVSQYSFVKYQTYLVPDLKEIEKICKLNWQNLPHNRMKTGKGRSEGSKEDRRNESRQCRKEQKVSVYVPHKVRIIQQSVFSCIYKKIKQRKQKGQKDTENK